VDAVVAHVAVSAADDDAEHRRLAALARVDAVGESPQRAGPLVDETRTELHLERRPTLSRIDDRVDLEPGLVAVSLPALAARSIRGPGIACRPAPGDTGPLPVTPGPGR
jgi:hypothetical protein